METKGLLLVQLIESLLLVALPLQAQQEAEQKNTLQEVNHILLRNILPEHVADHFIKFGQSDAVCFV